MRRWSTRVGPPVGDVESLDLDNPLDWMRGFLVHERSWLTGCGYDYKLSLKAVGVGSVWSSSS